MTIKLLTAAAAGFAASLGVSVAAATLTEEISLCVATINEEGLATTSDYRTEFVRTRGASAKRHYDRAYPACRRRRLNSGVQDPPRQGARSHAQELNNDPTPCDCSARLGGRLFIRR